MPAKVGKVYFVGREGQKFLALSDFPANIFVETSAIRS